VAYLALPLVLACFSFAAGLLAALRLGGSVPVLAAGAAAAVLAAAVFAARIPAANRDRPAAAALLAAFALAGAALGAGGRADALADCRVRLAEGTPLTVRGVLEAEAFAPATEDARIPLFPLRAVEVAAPGGPVPACRTVLRVRPPRDALPLPAGATVEFAGEWRRIPDDSPGSGWPRAGVWAGYVGATGARVLAAPDPRAQPHLAARGSMERRLHRLFPAHGAMAEALLLGRREMLDRELRDRFARAGLVHLLAISGTHVGLIAGVFLLLGRVARLTRRRVAWLTIGLLAVYLALIGAPASALRAGIMLSLGLVAVVLQRPSAALPIVAAAATALLALNPMWALDPGFQLSFAGVLGIVTLRRPMLGRLPERWREVPALRWGVESVVVSLAAFVATAPIVAHHFGQVAPVAIVANLPAVPLTALSLVGVGAAALLEPVAPPLARLVADGAAVMLNLLEGVVNVAVRVPGGHAPAGKPHWMLWAAVAVVFLVAMDAAARLRDRVRWLTASGAAAAAFLLLPAAAPAGGGMEIHFLDVGQGDATAIRTPAARWILVDAGPLEERFDAGERRVVPFLRSRGADRVAAMILTHPHADHIGGAPAVMRAMPVDALVEPGMPYGSPVYLSVLETAEARGVPWHAARQGRTLTVDGVEVRLLWPTPESLDASHDPNEISAVVHVRYGSFGALLTGDASSAVERMLVERYGDSLRADVLKAGHHGSRTSTSGAFLERVRPQLVVVSAGRRNRFGHPHAEVLAEVGVRGIPVARTDLDGTIGIVVEAGGGRWHRLGR
jgi:competence protein ComEC